MGSHWGDIRDALAADIRSGNLQPGDRLPTEPELCKRFDTGRHSVRKAIGSMARDGMLRAEQGRGTFVEDTALIDYNIGKRTRRSENFASNGVSAGGSLISVETVPANAGIAERLGLAVGDLVTSVTRLSEAGGAPIAYGTVFRSAVHFPDFIERQANLGSVTKTYASYGISDYHRASTNIVARRSTPDEATRLRQHPDQPVMFVRAVDVDLSGTPLSYSEVAWAATRVSFTLDTTEAFDV